MSYKRIVKKRGKNYGPYIYESYRDEDGKVRKRYLGKFEKKRVCLSKVFLIGSFIFMLLFGIGYTTDIFLNNGRVSENIVNLSSGFFSKAVGGITGFVIENKSGNESVVEEIQKYYNESEVAEVDKEVGRVIENINETDAENITKDTDILMSNETEIVDVMKTYNNTLVNVTVVNNTLIDDILVNNTLINNTIEESFNDTSVNVLTLQYGAVIGRPVKWIKKIDSIKGENLSVELPRGANNISVLTDNEVEKAIGEIGEYDKVISGINREELTGNNLITGNVILDIKESENIFVRFWNWITSFVITGDVVLKEEIVDDITESGNVTVIDIGNIVSDESEVAIEYYTEAPLADHVNLSNGKRVVVYAPDELNYSDVLSYLSVDDLNIKMGDDSLKLYWYESVDDGLGLKEEVGGLLNGSIVRSDKVEVNYDSYDFDGDGNVDYIEWVVPHLSAQVYDVVIEITKAELLDSNRDFVADVYDHVKARDDNWVNVNDSQFVRIFFEENLTSINDITLYARANKGSRVEIYLKGRSDLVAEFDNVSSEGYYKRYLTGLVGSSSEFDLKVFGSIEFDYIVDPIIGVDGNIDFVFPTPDNNTRTEDTSVGINVSVDEPNLKNLSFNWNGTNYSFFDDGLILAYNFDNRSLLGENGSYVVDISNAENNGTVYGASWNSSGKYGGAYEFDGYGDYIIAGHGDILIPPFSISAWVNVRDGDVNTIVSENRSLVDGQGDFFFLENGCLKYQTAGSGSATVSSNQSVLNNTWYYVVMTTDGDAPGDTQLYINGVQNDDGSPTDNGAKTGDGIYIGRQEKEDYSRDFNGTIDDVSIWNRSLSSDEVQQLYGSSLTKYNSSSYNLYVGKSDLGNENYTYYACAGDKSNNKNCTEIRNLEINDSVVDILVIYPANPINVFRGDAFNVTVNVSCIKGICGEVNSSLRHDKGGFFLLLNNTIPFDHYTSIMETSDSKLIFAGIVDGNMILSKFYPNGTEIWSKSYDYFYDDIINDIVEDGDGNFVVVGRSNHPRAYDYYSILSKFYPNGTEIWTTVSYDGLGSFFSVLETSDGNLSLSGVTSPGGPSHQILSKFYPNGTEIWTRNISVNYRGSDFKMIETSGDNLIMVGTVGAQPTLDTLVSKFYPNGTEIWTHIINGSVESNLYGRRLVELFDGNIASLSLVNPSDYTLVSKFYPNGTEIWGKTVNGTIPVAIQTSDGNMTLVGYMENGFFISKWNLDGSEVLTKFINLSSSFEVKDAIETSENDLIITGVYNGSISIFKLGLDLELDYENISNYSLDYINYSYNYADYTIENVLSDFFYADTSLMEGNIYKGVNFLFKDDLIKIAGNPFFVNSGNPVSNILSIGDNFITNWWLTASGELGNYNLIARSNAHGTSSFDSFNVTILSSAPNNPVVLLSTDSGVNSSSDALVCQTTVSDPNTDYLTIYFDWYSNGILNQSYVHANVINGSWDYSVLGSGNTTRDDNWSCSVRVYDSVYYSNWSDSGNLTVLNSVPIITLTSPDNWVATTNRFPSFNWTVYDEDGDNITYEWNLTEVDFVAGNDGDYSCDDDRSVIGLHSLGYIPTSVLHCLYDRGYYYLWKVRAYDGFDYGEWAEFGLNISADLSFSLSNSDMNFGVVQPSESNDTVDDLPLPFVIDSTSNALINISVNSTALWINEPNGGAGYKMKVSNILGEEGAFSWVKSLINWFNVTINANVIAIGELNYTTGNNSAEVDVGIVVPDNEVSGTKSSTVIFTSELAE